MLLALRDAESRVRFLGYSATNAKLFVFTVSAILAGIAGALYVPQVGIINPSEFSPANSIEIAIWVSVGGRGTLVGAIVGAVLVNFAKTWLTGAVPEIWLFVLGGLFVLTTLVFPRGIVGLFGGVADAGARRRRSEAPAAPRSGMSATNASPATTLLYLNGVTVSFDGFKALNELSLIVERASCARSSARTAPARRR